ncbi:MAG: UMP kinase [Candidatus Nomurabacteria bacterium]|jgi:uridylate kinase|nr:UMP kinase [Candidatus Nomurabacteria bacterium]
MLVQNKTEVFMKRILLKISGEQLGGKNSEGGFDVEVAKRLAKEVEEVIQMGAQMAIMVGGGNFIRGSQVANEDIDRVTADNAGMLSTVINAILLGDVFQHAGVPVAVLSNMSVPQIVDDFTYRRALNHFSKDRVVILAGGTGMPFVTTDTGAIMLALQLKCDVVAKATKVDGVYVEDPIENPKAHKLETLTYNEAVTNSNIRVMDKAALGMAGDNHLPIVIFELLKDGNITKIAKGENLVPKLAKSGLIA